MNHEAAPDLILCSVPKMELSAPYVGPAQLKSYLESHGFRVRCFDLNVALYRSIGESYRPLWLERSLAFSAQQLPVYQKALFPNFIAEWAQKLIALKAKYIGISCITYVDRPFALELAKEIKARCPEQKIVIGGTDVEQRLPTWITLALVDHFILGDAEEPLLALLQGRVDHPGIDRLVQNRFKDIHLLPPPDYSDFVLADYADYPFADYDSPDASDPAARRMLYLTSSRGCVRNCEFCDIGHYWDRFQTKGGDQIANEMIQNYEAFGVRYFYFTDSLINGNLRVLRGMCERLVEYRRRTGVGLRWRAQFIVSRRDFFGDDLYSLMRQAGCDTLIVGIESGSGSVRTAMKKSFSNDDMWNFFERLRESGIRVGLLFLVGFPTETEADFNESLDFLRRLKNYAPTIEYISVGHTMYVLWDTPVYRKLREYGIVFDFADGWRNEHSTPAVRFARLQKFKSLALSLGFQIRDPRTEFLQQDLEWKNEIERRIREPNIELFESRRTAWRRELAVEQTLEKALRLIRADFALMRAVANDRALNDGVTSEVAALFNLEFLRDLDESLKYFESGTQASEPPSEVSALHKLAQLNPAEAFKLLFYSKECLAYSSLLRAAHASSHANRGSTLENAEKMVRTARMVGKALSLMDDTRHLEWIDFFENRFGAWAAVPVSVSSLTAWELCRRLPCDIPAKAAVTT